MADRKPDGYNIILVSRLKFQVHMDFSQEIDNN